MYQPMDGPEFDVLTTQATRRAYDLAADVTRKNLEERANSGQLPPDMDPEQFTAMIPQLQQQTLDQLIETVRETTEHSLFLKLYPEERENVIAAMLLMETTQGNYFDEELLADFPPQIVDPLYEVYGINQTLGAGLPIDRDTMAPLSPHAHVLVVAQATAELQELEIYMRPAYAEKTGYAGAPDVAREKIKALRAVGHAAAGTDPALDNVFNAQLEATMKQLHNMEFGGINLSGLMRRPAAPKQR